MSNNIERILNAVENVKYFFIDFDGTLIKNESLNKLSYQDLLNNFNVDEPISDQDWIQKCVGFTDKEIAEYFIKEYHLKATPEEVIKSNLESRFRLYRTMEFELNPLIKELLARYTDKQYIMLSNNDAAVINYQLEKQGIKEQISEIMSNHTTGLSKEQMLEKFIHNKNILPHEICCIDDEPRKIKALNKFGVITIYTKNYVNLECKEATYSFQWYDEN